MFRIPVDNSIIPLLFVRCLPFATLNGSSVDRSPSILRSNGTVSRWYLVCSQRNSVRAWDRVDCYGSVTGFNPVEFFLFCFCFLRSKNQDFCSTSHWRSLERDRVVSGTRKKLVMLQCRFLLCKGNYSVVTLTFRVLWVTSGVNKLLFKEFSVVPSLHPSSSVRTSSESLTILFTHSDTDGTVTSFVVRSTEVVERW